ncbi:MAG: RHS repeat-associated core domain-containing protein, partial [Pseudomonadota bacterium]
MRDPILTGYLGHKYPAGQWARATTPPRAHRRGLNDPPDRVRPPPPLYARYMDPALGMFIQPDWWEVDLVGTNRFAYSNNDPINLADPGGNIPYNPGDSTSTGWDDWDTSDGTETYRSDTDRGSSDYLNSDGDDLYSVGSWSGGFQRNEDEGRSSITGFVPKSVISDEIAFEMAISGSITTGITGAGTTEMA